MNFPAWIQLITKLILGSIFLGAPPCIFCYVLLEPKPPLFGILYSSLFGHFTFKTMVMYVLDGFKYVLLPLNPKANLFPYNLPHIAVYLLPFSDTPMCILYIYWLVVSTPLKNISQLG